MACTHCCSSKASSVSVEVAADADTMWSVVSNLEESAAAISAIRDFAYLHRTSKGKFEVGTVVRETRTYKKDVFVCLRQITRIDDGTEGDDKKRYVSFSTTQERQNTVNSNVSNTSTLTVIPLSETTCALVGSFAVASTGMITKIWIFFFMLCSQYQQVDNLFLIEMEEMAAAAEKKYAKQNPQPEQQKSVER